MRKTPHTAPPCEELDPATLAVNDIDGNAYDIKVVSVKKITLVLRKINKNCCHFLTPICTKSFAGWGFAPDPTGAADSAPPDL